MRGRRRETLLFVGRQWSTACVTGGDKKRGEAGDDEPEAYSHTHIHRRNTLQRALTQCRGERDPVARASDAPSELIF